MNTKKRSLCLEYSEKTAIFDREYRKIDNFAYAYR